MRGGASSRCVAGRRNGALLVSAGWGGGEQADLCLLLETVRRRSEMSHWLFGLIYDRIKCLVKAQTMHVKREALKEILITPQCLRCVCVFV